KDLRLVYIDQKEWYVSWGLSKQIRDAFLTSAIISSFRDTPSQLRITNYSWYGRLLKKIWEDKRNSIDDIGVTIQEKLNEKFYEVQNISNQIFSDVASTIQETINISFKDTNISFQLTVDNKADIHKNTQIYVDDGFKSHIGDKGSGIQSAIIINLFSYYCYVFHKNTSLLIIEEPELYLHPQARRTLSEKLEDFINLRNDKENQVILITHSSEFISAGKNGNGITIVRKDDKATNANHYSFSDIDTKELQTILRNENNEMFFANKVILVEGAEKYLVPAIANHITCRSGILDEQNISVIRTGGKGDIYKYFKILHKCQIECYILADRDFFFNGLSNLLQIMQEISCEDKKNILAFAKEVDSKATRGYKDKKKIEERTTKPEQSTDAKALCDALDELDEYKSEETIQKLLSIWHYVRPKIKKKDVVGYMAETGSYSQFLEYRNILWLNNVFILEKGELEDYYTAEGRQVSGGKEEKVIHILRQVDPENSINLDYFIDLSEFQEFLQKILQ
ncbi:MAG: AAA family ATPase, partial [Chloroflexota bacterium]